MYRKCNPNAVALFGSLSNEKTNAKMPWRVWKTENENLFILYRTEFFRVVFAPLYVIKIPFRNTINIQQTVWCFERAKHPEKLSNTADRIRYYRCTKGFLQSEVAEYVGINASTYLSYESGERDYYPIEKMQRIADFLQVDINELLDDYNRFLYEGQGRQIKKLRKTLGLTQCEFGKLYDVSTGTVKRWEQEAVRMKKKTWNSLNMDGDLSVKKNS